ncbi:MAG: hypothetical protein LUD12_01715 [Lachnospiraceae bacterium]|nr:hypothetical protein [Lachnospiraceae bacterium]
MIEVKKNRDKFDACGSCGSTENLVDICIRRNAHVNAVSICLCTKCVKSLWEQTESITEEGGEGA